MVLNGPAGRGATRFDAQLRVHGSKVGVDGPGADAERLGQLPVRETAGDESQDLDFSRCQAIRRGVPKHGSYGRSTTKLTACVCRRRS